MVSINTAADMDNKSEEISIDLTLSTSPFKGGNQAKDGHSAPPPGAYGFAFHEACWTIFTNRCSINDRDIQSLLDVCLSAPIQHGLPTVLNWGHDYGGYATYQSVQDELGSDLERRRLNFSSGFSGSEYCNPLDDTALYLAFLNQRLKYPDSEHNKVLPEASRDGNQTFTATTPRHAISVLPAENLQMILESLPLPDALAVRQASREFASLGLHDVFWRSRFLPGRELGYVFEAMPYFNSLPGRWRDLFHAVKHLFPSPRVTNRNRILILAASLQDLMRQAGSARCEGYTTSAFTQTHHPMSWVSASWVKGQSGSLHNRQVLIPDDLAAIFVSKVEVFGRQYVSGLRMEQTCNPDNSIILGYRRPRRDTLLLEDEQRHLRIAGFHVALDRDGVRGIAIITHSGTISRWAGEHDRLPKRRLVPSSHNGDTVEALSGGFDVSNDPSLALSSLFQNFS
jgi:hypothetical protein